MAGGCLEGNIVLSEANERRKLLLLVLFVEPSGGGRYDQGTKITAMAAHGCGDGGGVRDIFET